MRFLATADSLVNDELITLELDERNLEDAWTEAYGRAKESPEADENSLQVRPLEEDKQAICDKLLEALQLTSNLYDLIYLKYLPNCEKVVAHFPSGEKTVNVAMDSGTSMIRDIIRGIV